MSVPIATTQRELRAAPSSTRQRSGTSTSERVRGSADRAATAARPAKPTRGAVGSVLWIAVILLGCGVAAAAEVPPSTPALAPPFPVHEKLSYAVSWMGIRCGEMEILSFIDETGGSPIYRIVVLMRTTRFFDGIYRVRSRLDSFVDPKRMSSVRYIEQSLEKKKRKHDVWTVDHDARVVHRSRNGRTTEIPVEVDRAFDPLAFVFRLRSLPFDVGDQRTLGLMTSKGAVETIVTAERRKRVKTKMGRCDAVAMVPQPRDRMMFSKSGSMTVWLDTTPPHRPCRIVFDLSFGTLVASLRSHAKAGAADVVDDWENWGGK